jgi:NAD(P)H-quinone oxidoreductase subunit 5
MPARGRAHAAFCASLFALAVAAGTAGFVAFHGPMRTGTIGAGGIGFAVHCDALTAVLLVLVSFVGTAVIRFSARYMDGDARQERFIRSLCITLAAVLVVIISGNLAQLLLAWIATSVGLNRLLLFYRERPAAVLAARKKFLFSRLADLCLLAAMVLLYRAVGSLDYAVIFGFADALRGTPVIPRSVHAIALLLVGAAMLKSAQFPAHGWLTEVMETPTPVSALLHAGVINAGGFLVLRFAGLVALSAPALDTLVIVGGVTALFGSLVMLTQTSIKGSLAFSTISQMGFLMFECGVGAFALAVLHLVAHSLYKAHAFLSAGSVIDAARASAGPPARPHPGPLRRALVYAVVGGLMAWSLVGNTAEVALEVILLMSIAHLLVNALEERPSAYVLGRALGFAVIVAVACYALHLVVGRLFATTLPPGAGPGSPPDRLFVFAVLVCFGLVIILQNAAPRRSESAGWRLLYVHLANGLYVNAFFNRLAVEYWPEALPGRRLRE